MRNKLSDLNNLLFEQLERIMDDSLDDAEFEREKERSKLVTGVAQSIINNSKLKLAICKHATEYYGANTLVPELVGDVQELPSGKSEN